MKRNYKLVSCCLVMVLSCMCGLSACGEPVQTGGTAMGSVNNGTNHSKNVTIREAAIACNISETNVVDNGDLSEFYPADLEHSDEPTPVFFREISSYVLHFLTKDVPCIIRGLNHDDSKALELASKVERTFSKCNPDNINDCFKENNLSFINYVGRSYVIMLHIRGTGIYFDAFSVDAFNKYSFSKGGYLYN
ncbi:hypothetical protein HXT52_02180 [Gardnerella sp. KA00288]|uniref:hypothetical protein n=1 Tax=Gardnerella sp. KA00288 TaxID=2749074 RepID=UPI003BA842B9